MRIEGCTALVTGANRGLGRAFVEALMERGAARVHAAARSPDTLSSLVETSGGRVSPLALDVTDPGAVEHAAEAARDVTLLINNAGVLESRGLFEAGSVEPLRREMEVNVFGLARMSLAFAPVLQRNGGGAILNVLSTASLVAFPAFGSYAATKAAAMSLTHSMRYELQAQGTEVFGLYAGFIDTDMIGYVTSGNGYMDAEKSPPADVAAAGLDGIDAGIPDIDANEPARRIRKALRDDPEGLVRSSWERAAQFRAAYPLDAD